MIALPRDIDVLEDVSRLTTFAAWDKLKAEAEKKLETYEATLMKLIAKTRSPVDPLEVEYYRGFRQGVKYVIEGLPHEIQAELKRRAAES